MIEIWRLKKDTHPTLKIVTCWEDTHSIVTTQAVAVRKRTTKEKHRAGQSGGIVSAVAEGQKQGGRAGRGIWSKWLSVPRKPNKQGCPEPGEHEEAEPFTGDFP